MTKRSIAILIALMSIALIGIIVIQYQWIMKTTDEKQKLIDNNVQAAIGNVEEQLRDYRALTFIGANQDTNSFPFELFNTNDSIIIENWKDSNLNIEIQVLQNSEFTEFDSLADTLYSNHIFEINQTTSYNHKDEIQELKSLIRKLKVEIQGEDSDLRLDSVRLTKILLTEIEGSNIGKIANWGLYDKDNNSYHIQPEQEGDLNYHFDLFTSDILNPGRYELQLSLATHGKVYADIWQMIALSLLFLLIISVVFAYSIKLVIRHKKISQIKSDFINNMTHEFKTPLASISLAADTLMHPNTPLTREAIKEYAEFIKAEKTRLNHQVERILEVAALKKDRFDLKTQTINLNELTENVVRDLNLFIIESNTHLTIEIPSNMEIIGNNFHLINVLQNIIENAIKYTVGQPFICITAHVQDNWIVLSIADKGIGMNKKQLNYIFDDFYRAESGNIHTTKGFGLGLTYSKYMIEKMGGIINVESEIKKGTIVTIKLLAV